MHLRFIICFACVFGFKGFVLAELKEEIKGWKTVICEKDMALVGDNLVECFQNASLPLYTEVFTNCCPDVKNLNSTEEKKVWFCENDVEQIAKCHECSKDAVNKSEKKNEYEEEIKPFRICIVNSFQ